MPARHLKSRSDNVAVSTTPQIDVSSVVKGVIDDVRQNGDAAVRKYSEKFDKWSPASFKLSQADIDAAIAACPQQTIDDIKEVQKNVRAFAQAQRESLKDFEYEIQPVRPKQSSTGDSTFANIPPGRCSGPEESSY
ncbi:unnamed protein product [Aspergillus oryzae var. brunneus]|uniref:Unnamed protein product n=2 Tax=Aspergillus oryzae TaxID=5062 RepID=A0AAN5BWD2_ASPOZ|nr:unnamed protein product [Aspergillus oryzae]GMG27745.1 unnamed protein product [Aspergillus oryzae]GMG49784.1 unnamed protein product [Aspergillus oryzae var. brunneus]